MPRVLVVDDDRSVAHLLAEIVAFLRHEPVVLTDSIEALARYGRDFAVGAAIVDYLMPRLDGLELLAALQESNPRMRRVLVTAAPHEAPVREASRAGVVQMVIAKPPAIADIRVALAWL